LQQFCQRGSNNSFTQGRSNSSCYKNVFRHILKIFADLRE
jgi:hypothetical protein